MPAKHFVVKADDRLERSRVALPAAAAVELPVDAPRLVKLGEDHVQAATREHLRREANIGAPAGHVGGDRHPCALARARDDLRLIAILAGVQHDVL